MAENMSRKERCEDAERKMKNLKYYNENRRPKWERQVLRVWEI
jgi:hypothetical protein